MILWLGFESLIILRGLIEQIESKTKTKIVGNVKQLWNQGTEKGERAKQTLENQKSPTYPLFSLRVSPTNTKRDPQALYLFIYSGWGSYQRFENLHTHPGSWRWWHVMGPILFKKVRFLKLSVICSLGVILWVRNLRIGPYIEVIACNAVHLMMSIANHVMPPNHHQEPSKVILIHLWAPRIPLIRFFNDWQLFTHTFLTIFVFLNDIRFGHILVHDFPRISFPYFLFNFLIFNVAINTQEICLRKGFFLLLLLLSLSL